MAGPPLHHFTTAERWKEIQQQRMLRAPVHLTTNPDGREFHDPNEAIGQSWAQVRITVVLPEAMVRADPPDAPGAPAYPDAWYTADRDLGADRWVQVINVFSGAALWP